MDFDSWREMADAIVIRRTGLDIDSFEDWNWRDAFEDGLSFSEAANDFLEEIMRGF